MKKTARSFLISQFYDESESFLDNRKFQRFVFVKTYYYDELSRIFLYLYDIAELMLKCRSDIEMMPKVRRINKIITLKPMVNFARNCLFSRYRACKRFRPFLVRHLRTSVETDRSWPIPGDSNRLEIYLSILFYVTEIIEPPLIP